MHSGKRDEGPRWGRGQGQLPMPPTGSRTVVLCAEGQRGGGGGAPWGTEQVTPAHGPGEHGGLLGGQEVLGR